MEQTELNNFRAVLERQLDDLSKEAGHDLKQLKDVDHREIDFVDSASDDENKNLQYRIIDRESKLIKKIRDALERIEDGTYGICEACGKEISIERLKARPVTNKCIECKTMEERHEKPKYHY